MRGSHGWRELRGDDKRALIEAIAGGKAPRGPLHLELDLTDRCNVDCYFCNQMDVRTKDQIPYEKIVEILDETAANGLRSVRLAGGGDPLFHRQIDAVIDAIHDHKLVIDNITTNGLGLTAPVAERLVKGQTREVLFSLNAADAADYARMMQVKPAIFDKVVANIEHLRKLRGDQPYPHIIVQFLIDRENVHRLVDMYALGSKLCADTIAVNAVLEIPLERIDRKVLLDPSDVEMIRPHLRALLEADRDAGLLQICFATPAFNQLLQDLQREMQIQVDPGFTTAPTFQEKNGQCFFGFYSAVVRGNGDMYPCCMLLKPDYKPLGNATAGKFNEQWQGERFQRLRHEMREVMIAGGEAEFREGEYQTLGQECVNAHACGLKNMYFRSDESFYRDLAQAMDKTRAKEVRWFGSRQQIARALQHFKRSHPRLRAAYEYVATHSPRMRAFLKRRLGVNLAGNR